MKKKALSAITLVWAACCPAAASAGGGLVLRGTINGFEGRYIHLLRQDGSGLTDDSTKIENGAFAFTAELAEPMTAGGLAIGDMQDRQNTMFCSLFLEPKAMTVAIDKDNFGRPKVTGSQSQADYDSLNLIQDSLVEEMNSARAEMETCTDGARRAELEQVIDGSRYKAIQASIGWIKEHPASLIAPMQLQLFTGNMTYEEIKSVYDSFTPAVKQLSAAGEIKRELDILKNVQPGQPAPYFRAKSDKGEMISLADLRGKYVLLDFWATWCVPCRRSFPHVKALYEKYGEKGLDMFCVADDDGNEARWKAAIEKDGVQSFHHVLRGYKRNSGGSAAEGDAANDISDKYAIHYLPTKYLIDKDGCIVGKFSDEELDAKLKEIFGF